MKVTEESYTSKASLLDLDKIPVYDPKWKEKPKFSGKRIKRGLYRAADGRLVNADINGAGNTTRKVAPKAFGSKGVEDGKGMLAFAGSPSRAVSHSPPNPKREIPGTRESKSNVSTIMHRCIPT